MLKKDNFLCHKYWVMNNDDWFVLVCLRGIKANRKCYLTSEEAKHYHEANEDCIAQGGTLATPRDLLENNELRDYAKRSAPASRDFWIGVADIVKEGQYVDVNSLPVSFFNWDRSKKQPTGTKRESCVALSAAGQGKWHDEVCRHLKKYICEYVIPWGDPACVNQQIKGEKRQASRLCCFMAETCAAVASSCYSSHYILNQNAAIWHCHISNLH